MFDVKKREKVYIVDPFFDTREKERDGWVQEIKDLCNICDFEIIECKTIFVRNKNISHLISKGIMADIVKDIEEKEPDIVAFSCFMSSGQMFNFSNKLNNQYAIFDRARLIIEVFIKRAGSSTSVLQAKLALLKYKKKNLRDVSANFSQQKKSFLARGIGEKQIEIDKRKIDEQMLDIKRKLEEIKQTSNLKSKSREKNNLGTFALTGYTNAGKSSMMQCFVKEEVYIDSRVFATLDTKTRNVKVEGFDNEFIISDTIGFIRGIPSYLLEAFRSTINEAIKSKFILLVVDISDPELKEKLDFMIECFKEVGRELDKSSCLFVFNKIDKISATKAYELSDSFNMIGCEKCFVSAKTGEGMQDLVRKMSRMIVGGKIKKTFSIPMEKFFDVKNAITKDQGNILKYEHSESGNCYVIEAVISEKLSNIIDMRY